MELTIRFVELCYAVFLIYWIVAAFFVKRTVEKRPLPRLLFVLILGTYFLFRSANQAFPSWNVTFWQRTLLTGLIADAVVLAGLIVSIWARITLGGNWSYSVTFKENHELIERGLYRYVRHPIYSGLLLMALGTAILVGKLLVFTVLVIVFLGVWIKWRQEELLLTRHFPQAYPDYKRRVRALIPHVF